ncbi:pyridoxal-5'-phosphate-dependent protein subunit beta [Variovorax paradoxus]|jgi:threonine synthase|uniref:threonine synthase n=1 Tax=Variovorax TaxID=34072 RepID=UPI0006E65B5C|nr:MULTISPECIES: pyridoxal-phosphate dependent enzyme [unclassified Variovorax]KPU93614.1 pyridoxal-5'-phosphate-dependent protein subunit beta [Variovorax paradoxus]KPU97263.1 pyridoxal-5'-phosphate-dependent protein subunit beta [Variovorax paradoxus]KPV04868.1 pyridoxal-5'-phosphate-dependent protein subunit beta [Variovorax paradoxus]KPV14463.1 pyridoxal-5'-phosphate-dependent protein subunit beta [Variovorax paradoxus]KPV29485.1 pyridoxal-5'-phosphate-dependent protein subunit beta [Vario
MPNTPHYIDPRTGRTHGLLERRWRSDDGHPMMITPLPGISRDDIDTRVRSLWRYRAALPVAIEQPASLGEGCTPLVQKRWGGLEPFFKLEWFNPTCSFKDRGAAVMMSFLRQIGVDAVLEDSSGNGGAAIAASGAAAGLRVKVLAPAYTPAPKVAQIRAFGAEVQLVPGPREASEEEAVRQSSEIFYASHNWHPFFLQGTKTLAYELWEDLGFEAPDNVIIPAGAGSNVLGCHIGFQELLAAGQIRRLPRIFVAQPLNCSPIDASFTAGVETLVERAVAPTIAEGTAIKRPVRLREILQALRETRGGTVALTEEQIAAAVRRLAATGLYAEPTSSSAAAAIELLEQRGEIRAGEKTVVLLTGTGLKSTQFMTELFAGAAG